MTDKELIATLRMAADWHDPAINIAQFVKLHGRLGPNIERERAVALRAAADRLEALPAPDAEVQRLRDENSKWMTEVGQAHAALDAARAEAAHWQRVAEWLRGEAAP